MKYYIGLLTGILSILTDSNDWRRASQSKKILTACIDSAFGKEKKLYMMHAAGYNHAYAYRERMILMIVNTNNKATLVQATAFTQKTAKHP